MRKISATMASQHPDHASKPFWHETEFINTHAEIQEAFINFSELGINEYKWDWEGKLVDESVLERMWGQHYEYFQKDPIGKNKFMTFRLPNPKVETEFRLGRAFMGILSAGGLAEQVGLHSPPLFEVILPMTESAEEMIDVQQAFKELSSLKHKLLRVDKGSLRHIEIIPLFESVDTIMNSDKILEEYLEGHQWLFGFKPAYMRPYVARSDPALNAGIIPTVLAIKIALSSYKQFEKKFKIHLFPIIGSASLPFRGGLTPHTVEQFVNEYKGIRTALIQSGFRYDYKKEDVIKGIQQLEDLLPKNSAVEIPKEDEKKLREIIKIFEKLYQSTVEEIAGLINDVASQLPKRRERVQHVGLFGYSRGLGKVKLPRAIGFTGALYSIGVPPELIGTGRGLSIIEKKGLMPILEKYYLNIRSDLKKAGAFLNKENLKKLAAASKSWKSVSEDVAAIEKYLRIELGPTSIAEKEHSKIAGKILGQMTTRQDPEKHITQAALLRKSLG